MSLVARDSCLLNLSACVVNSRPFLAISSACQLSPSTSFPFPESHSVDGISCACFLSPRCLLDSSGSVLWFTGSPAERRPSAVFESSDFILRL